MVGWHMPPRPVVRAPRPYRGIRAHLTTASQVGSMAADICSLPPYLTQSEGIGWWEEPKAPGTPRIHGAQPHFSTMF